VEVIHPQMMLCSGCRRLFDYRHAWIKIHGFNAYIPFRYDDHFKSQIFQLKTSHDIELGPTFLDPLLPFIYLWFGRRDLIYAPSADAHIKERGFHHLDAIYDRLKKPIHVCFQKTFAFKQAEQSFIERRNLEKHVRWNPQCDALDKRKGYLVVDDVYTTGNTMNVMANILKEKGFKNLRFFALAKTEKLSKDL
jgi:predicted amidophosphoribosyltransferase